jgi:erythronate-4-phosphate dehydrogenase
MKIIADDKIPFLKGVLEPFAEVRYWQGKQISRDILTDADALLVRTRTRCNGDLLNGTGVKFIGTATIGYDHIDTEYCASRNIFWTNAPGCNSSSVQQYIAASLLRIADRHGFDLEKKTLGIIGVGNVGSKVERFAKAIGMKVLLNDPPRARNEGIYGFSELSVVLKHADIVTVHVPLNMEGNDRTYHLFEDSTFSEMKHGAWFINSSRGEIVATSALKNALRSGRLSGTVLDVWENEPDIDEDLLANAFLSTPHIAGYSADGKANGTSMVVNALCRFFGLPLKDWYPAGVPLPQYGMIKINAAGRSDQDVILEAVSHTYDINEDSISLKSTPAGFEKLRGAYHVRREFPAYTIDLIDGTLRVRNILTNLGFNVL